MLYFSLSYLCIHTAHTSLSTVFGDKVLWLIRDVPMPKQTLKVLAETFAIHSFDADTDIPAKVFKSSLYFIGKTPDELSIVLPQSVSLPSVETDFDWRVLEVLGPLNLTLVGIMSEISGVLADAKVSIFVLSTFDTDFVLVKQNQLDTAINALTKAGYSFSN